MNFIFVLLSLVFVFHVLSRLSQIDAALKELKGEQKVGSESTRVALVAAPSALVAQEAVTPVSSAPQFIPYSVTPAEVAYAPAENHFTEWLKQDFFVKLGAFLLLLAMGWFVSYAFANNWIGPAGRIACGLLLGAGTMVVAVWRIATHPHQGGIFTVLGATTILLTLFAARTLYDFFTPASALVMIFVVASFVAFVSMRYARESLAMAGVIMGMIAPLLIDTPTPDTAGLFFYLLIVALGSIWVVSRTGWSTLTPLALTIVSFYSVPYLSPFVDDSEREIAFMFSFVFAALFFVTNMTSTVRRIGYKNLQAQIYTALGTALFLVCWIEAAAEPVWKSLLLVAWALVFALGAYMVAIFTKNTHVFYLYGATAVGFLGIATAAELSGPVLVVAFLLEITALLLAALLMRASVQLLSRLSWLLAIPVILSVPSFAASSWRDSIMHTDFVVLLIAAIVLAIAGSVLAERSATSDNKTPTTIRCLYSASGFYVFALVWLIAQATFTPDIASMVALTVYTFVGIVTFIYGRVHGVPWARTVGMLLIGAVMMRLLFVEVWQMNIAGRIITFFVIGIMLVSTAFIRQTKTATSAVTPR